MIMFTQDYFISEDAVLMLNIWYHLINQIGKHFATIYTLLQCTSMQIKFKNIFREINVIERDNIPNI